jgi:hypothetical protein
MKGERGKDKGEGIKDKKSRDRGRGGKDNREKIIDEASPGSFKSFNGGTGR